MRVIESTKELEAQVDAGRREAEAAFGNGEVDLEKLVKRARHRRAIGCGRGRPYDS